jgi:phytoene dehydrogenase-like protein
MEAQAPPGARRWARNAPRSQSSAPAWAASPRRLGWQRRGSLSRYTSGAPSGAYMLYLGVSRRYPQLLHHNVFFGADYRGSFDDIFHRFRVPADPSFYVNVSARTEPSAAPRGTDGIYVLRTWNRPRSTPVWKAPARDSTRSEKWRTSAASTRR